MFSRLFRSRRPLSSRKHAQRRSVQLRLEALEERYALVAGATSGNFSSSSGNFSAVNDALSTSNDFFSGPSSWFGHVGLTLEVTGNTGGNITATVLGSGDDGDGGATFTVSGNASAKLTDNNFAGKLNWTGTDTDGNVLKGYGYFYGTESSGAVQNGKYYETIVAENPGSTQPASYYTWNGASGANYSTASNWLLSPALTMLPRSRSPSRFRSRIVRQRVRDRDRDRVARYGCLIAYAGLSSQRSDSHDCSRQ